jgi:hypothetical protein
MREMSVQGVLVYCADYRCSHSVTLSANRWPDDLRLSDVEPRFTCTACGRRGADVARSGLRPAQLVFHSCVSHPDHDHSVGKPKPQELGLGKIVQARQGSNGAPAS